MKLKAIIYNNDDNCPGWIIFDNPDQVIVVNTPDDVIPGLIEIEKLVNQGFYAVGYLGYEAAPAFDNALKVKKSKYPVMMFGIYRNFQKFDIPNDDDFQILNLSPDITSSEYNSKITAIKDYIASGDTYQVNFTYKLTGDFTGNPLSLFSVMNNAQMSKFSVFLQNDDFAIISVSPELFFSKNRNQILCKPMKGTAPRANTQHDDILISHWLKQSEKNRAENVMIADMVRNDLGKIAKIGTVETDLFKIERYPSVWQMISDVHAESNASIVQIFSALFPSASITGAPKVRTMEIIEEIENNPREIYTGAIGMMKPGGDSFFNVAIRTALIDLKSNHIEYGVGGGITWDSNADDEFEETIHKALVITEEKKDFRLFETMLWNENGIFLLNYHIKRLKESADYFNYPLDIEYLMNQLTKLHIDDKKAVVKIELASSGDIKIEIKKYPEKTKEKWRVTISDVVINSKNRMLYHKTTVRDIYNNARENYPGFDDVIFINEDDYITESTIANIVIEKDNNFITPPVSCGLLNGTFRQYLIDEGQITENYITIADLMSADNLFLINSIREWIPIDFSPA